MHPKNMILVMVDPTQGAEQCAITRGVWLAQKLDAGLNLVISQYRQYPTALGLVDPDLMASARNTQGRHYQSYLEKLAQRITGKVRDIELTTLVDSPLTDAVIGHAMATDALMLVKQARHHALLDRTLLTNSDWEFVRNCPVPLWLAKGSAWPEDAAVLASVDPTNQDDRQAKLDRKILDTADMIAAALKAETHVFHSFMPMPLYAHTITDGDLWTPADVDTVQLAAHSDRVEELLAGRDIQSDRVHVEAGSTSQLLPACAATINAGVVVMGSISRSRLKRIFVGNTVEKVLENIACDVVVIKPTSFVCPFEARPPADFAWRDTERPTSGDGTDSHPPVWIP